VHVSATVTDADGRLVKDLTKDDFEISEIGHPQTISHFTAERVPVSLGLLIDVSDSMLGQRIVDARKALEQFFVERLLPTDEAFLLSFNHQPTVEAPWTLEPAKLASRLPRLKPFGGTAIYDAMMTALPMFDNRKHQRAAIVLVSDGADTASDATVRDVRRLQHRSDAFVYAIAIDAGPNESVHRRVNPFTLREITDESGGYTEVLTKSEDLDGATARIAEELNHQYMLGFTPTRPGDGQYRGLRVKMKNPAYKVRARRGYIAGMPTKPSDEPR
jgi:Ca-activated chloride channel family protein